MISQLWNFHFGAGKRRFTWFLCAGVIFLVYVSANVALLHRSNNRVTFEGFAIAFVVLCVPALNLERYTSEGTIENIILVTTRLISPQSLYFLLVIVTIRRAVHVVPMAALGEVAIAYAFGTAVSYLVDFGSGWMLQQYAPKTHLDYQYSSPFVVKRAVTICTISAILVIYANGRVDRIFWAATLFGLTLSWGGFVAQAVFGKPRFRVVSNSVTAIIGFVGALVFTTLINKPDDGWKMFLPPICFATTYFVPDCILFIRYYGDETRTVQPRSAFASLRRGLSLSRCSNYVYELTFIAMPVVLYVAVSYQEGFQLAAVRWMLFVIGSVILWFRPYKSEGSRAVYLVMSMALYLNAFVAAPAIVGHFIGAEYRSLLAVMRVGVVASVFKMIRGPANADAWGAATVVSAIIASVIMVSLGLEYGAIGASYGMAFGEAVMLMVSPESKSMPQSRNIEVTGQAVELYSSYHT